MFRWICHFIVAFVVTFLAIVPLTSASIRMVRSAESQWQPVRNEVLKRDVRGRVQLMRARGNNGTCYAEIVYEGLPRIYVLALSHQRQGNIGALLIRDGTEENLSDAVLMKAFNKAIGYCIPFIIKGYTKV